MGLFDDLFGENEEDKKKRKQELEDELDLYDLEDWEKDEIRENDYDVTDVIEDAIDNGDLDEDEEYW